MPQNLFGGLPQQAPPPGGQDPTGDDIQSALAQMMAAQQEGEPTPRPPTPEEAQQLKQAGAQMMAAKQQGLTPTGQPNATPTLPPPSGQAPPTPPAPGGGEQQAGQLMFGLSPDGGQPPSSPPPSPPPQNPRGNPNYVPSSALFDPATVTAEQGMGVQFQDPEKPLFTPPKEHVYLGGLPHTSTDKTLSPEEMEKEFGPSESSQKSQEAGAGMDDLLKLAEEKGAAPEQGQSEQDEHAELVKYAPEARKVADAIVASGANTPEKAEIVIRSKFHDDPQLEQAIKEAKDTYNQLREVNNRPPSTVQFIGAMLFGLLGAHPAVISSILHPDQHLNAMREQQSGENLLKLQLQRAHGFQQDQLNQQRMGEDSMAQKRMDQQKQLFQQGEDFKTQAAQRQHEQQMWQEQFKDASAKATKFRELMNTAIGAQKAQLEADAKDAENRAEFYRQMMGGPSRQQMEAQGLPRRPIPVQPKPIGMGGQAPQGPQVSQSAMRLLGMGA